MTTIATLSETVTARQDIKKSRFVATAGPVADEAAAKAFVALHSDPSANHNCWAWRIGQTYRFSDDGEPGGTAGKPILQAIDGQGLDNVAVVVTRWFGGILLGGGGLIRAYGGTAALCLREAGRVELIETATMTIACSFSDLTAVQARLGAMPGVQITGQVYFEDGGRLTVSAPRDQVALLQQRAADLTSGRAIVKLEDDQENGGEGGI